MELKLNRKLQKGIEPHKTGNAQEADRFYTATLKANPKHTDANHNMGILTVGVDKTNQAMPPFYRPLWKSRAEVKRGRIRSNREKAW